MKCASYGLFTLHGSGPGTVQGTEMAQWERDLMDTGTYPCLGPVQTLPHAIDLDLIEPFVPGLMQCEYTTPCTRLDPKSWPRGYVPNRMKHAFPVAPGWKREPSP